MEIQKIAEKLAEIEHPISKHLVGSLDEWDVYYVNIIKNARKDFVKAYIKGWQDAIDYIKEME